MVKLCIVILSFLVIVHCGLFDRPIYSHSDQYWVSPSTGNDFGPGTQTKPFQTISAALFHLNPGGVANLMPGKYSGSKNTHLLLNEGVKIVSVSDDPAEVFIDCSGTYNNVDDCFYVSSRYPVTFSGITLSSANSSAIGFYSSLNSVDTYFLDDMVFVDSVKSVYSNVSAVTVHITNSTFTGSGSSTVAQGIYCEAGYFLIKDSLFIDLTSDTKTLGFAIHVENGIIDVYSSKFSVNSASISDSDSLQTVYAVDAQVSMYGCEISGTSAAYVPSSFFSGSSGVFSFSDCSFENINGTSATVMYLQNSVTLIDSCAFRNMSGANGGALYVYSGSVIIENTLFSDIRSVTGGIYLYRGSLSFQDVWFTHSSATDGGAVYASSSTITVLDSVFRKNVASDQGNDIYCNQGSVLHFSNTLFSQLFHYPKCVA